MIEHPLQRLSGESAPDAAEIRRRRGRTDLGIIAGSVVVGIGLMPFLYAAALVDVGMAAALSGDTLRHILINAGVNTLVMIWAARLGGRLDHKLAAVLSRALILHGSLAFWILVAREPYSNQVMLMAGGASAIAGPTVVLIRHCAHEVRAALLGPWHPLVERVQIPCDLIRDPATSLAPYDVLLTASVVDLSPEWATALSKAMLMGQPVRLLAEFVEETQGIVSLEHFDLEHLPEAGLTSYRTRKRLMDIGLVVLGLPVALPLLLIGAVLVLVTMGRPVLFVQPRVGLGGSVFRMFKLRTMQVAPPEDGVRATSTGDLRVTTVGKVLRRFRIDELPQLLNVLRGDMSVIGPRPEQPALAEEYVRKIPTFAYRSLVRPGITGWAQVMYPYGATVEDAREKLQFELYYIKNYSLILDAAIILRTIRVVVTGSGR